MIPCPPHRTSPFRQIGGWSPLAVCSPLSAATTVSCSASRHTPPLPALLLLTPRCFASTPSPGLLSRWSLIAPVLRRPHAPTRQAQTLSAFFQRFVLRPFAEMALSRAEKPNRGGGEPQQYLSPYIAASLNTVS